MFGVLLLLSACQQEEPQKTKEVVKTEEKKEEVSFQPKDGYKESEKVDEKISEDLYVSAVGWGEKNAENAYIEFFMKENGQWKSKKVQPIDNSVQFEPRIVKVIEIDKKTKMVTILYKDVSRGFIGTVSQYIVKNQSEIIHVGDYTDVTFLKEEVKELNSEELKYLKESGHIEEDVSEKAVMVFWDNKGMFYGYDNKNDKSIVKEIKDGKTLADMQLGVNQYVGIHLKKDGLGISAVTGVYDDRKVSEKTKLETITVKKGSNLVFLNEVEGVSVHSDLENPGIFYRDNEVVSSATLLKTKIIQGLQEGEYMFILEDYENQKYHAFQLIVK